MLLTLHSISFHHQFAVLPNQVVALDEIRHAYSHLQLIRFSIDVKN